MAIAKPQFGGRFLEEWQEQRSKLRCFWYARRSPNRSLVAGCRLLEEWQEQRSKLRCIGQ